MSGYVRIHRSLIGHPAFRNESETMAFAWLIAKAAWRATRVRYKGHAITLKRGQLAISQRDMAEAFDRDKAWIMRLLNRLISETMVETHVETGVTVITVCNYDEYQGETEDRETPRETPREARSETDVRQTRGTEQEEKKGRIEEEELMPDKSGDYAFFGQTIKLAPRHFDEWKRLFKTILDLEAELSVLDGWWQSQPEAKRGNWFLATKGMLNRKHQENLSVRAERERGEGGLRVPC